MTLPKLSDPADAIAELGRQRRTPAKEVSPNLFLHHRCYKCRDGTLPCITLVPGNCGNPIAKND